jgi:hypothetical protein
MKKTSTKKAVKNLVPKKSTALIGTAGITVIGAAAAGVAGYLLWRNRSSILNFVGQYVDLPESMISHDEDESFDSDSEEASTSKSFERQPSQNL